MMKMTRLQQNLAVKYMDEFVSGAICIPPRRKAQRNGRRITGKQKRLIVEDALTDLGKVMHAGFREGVTGDGSEEIRNLITLMPECKWNGYVDWVRNKILEGTIR